MSLRLVLPYFFRHGCSLSQLKPNHDWSPCPIIIPHVLAAPPPPPFPSVSSVHSLRVLTYPPCFVNSWMFTSCHSHHPFWLGCCWEDLLFSFRILFVPLFAVSIKDEIEISCTDTRTHMQTNMHTQTGITVHTAKHVDLQKHQQRAVPRHMKEHKPPVLLLPYRILILSLQFLPLSPLAAISSPSSVVFLQLQRETVWSVFCF